MSKDKITTLVLEDPDRLCNEDSKEDTEAMFIDPIYNVGYIIQKVRPRNEIKTPVIFKVMKITMIISKIILPKPKTQLTVHHTSGKLSEYINICHHTLKYTSNIKD